MNQIDTWEDNQIIKIFNIASSNGQVKYILNDTDINKFYLKIYDKKYIDVIPNDVLDILEIEI